MMKQRSDLDTRYVGTVFDRQVRIEDWDQDILKNQTVLCLGAGGLGSVVILSLLRLGVGRIIIVDYDKVDVHNLNRQLMYSVRDIGKSKVECCLKNAQFHKVQQSTEVIGFEGCALTNWAKIVDFAKTSNFIFNMIDFGDWFDAAVQSLGLALKIPVVQGGTFALSLTVDYFSPTGQPCYYCLTDEIRKDNNLYAKVAPEVILQLQQIRSFLPKNNNPIGRSSVSVCTMCGEFMISQYLNYLFFHKESPLPSQRTIFYTSTLEVVSFPLEAEPGCPACKAPPRQVAPAAEKPVQDSTPANQTQKQSPAVHQETPKIQQTEKLIQSSGDKSQVKV